MIAKLYVARTGSRLHIQRPGPDRIARTNRCSGSRYISFADTLCGGFPARPVKYGQLNQPFCCVCLAAWTRDNR